MTLDRAADLQRGIGPPATPDELRDLEDFEARAGELAERFTREFGSRAAHLAAQMRPLVKAYPAAMRVFNAAPKAERKRLGKLPVLVVAAMARPKPVAQTARTPRTRRGAARARARAPSRRDDDPHELAAALAALIDAHGPRSACWLAPQVRRQKKVVLQALHLGRFVQVGKGRSTTWDNEPVAPVAFRDAVWRARHSGAIDGIEALELLLEPPPGVLAMLAGVAA